MENSQLTSNDIYNNENEVELGEIKEKENMYKPDYKEQKLDTNVDFINWKNKMLKKYGNDAVLFKCINDGVYFFTPYKDYKHDNFLTSYCPSCNKQYCIDCFQEPDDEYIYGDCCIKRRLKVMIIKNGMIFINEGKKKKKELLKQKNRKKEPDNDKEDDDDYDSLGSYENKYDVPEYKFAMKYFFILLLIFYFL